MQFRLSTLFLLFVVLWSSMAVFGGPGGVIVFVLLVLVAICIAGRSWLVALFGLLLLVALLAPFMASAREAARRMMCSSNMKAIVMALLNYEVEYRCFPPAYIADKNGKPMHSWRVLILPYLENDPLYKVYNFNEPWDGPNNKKLLAARPDLFACWSDSNAHSPRATSTNYVAVVGSRTAWPGAKPGKRAGDSSSTIMVVEVADADIQWTAPRDLDIDSLRAVSPSCMTVSSKHYSGHEFFTYSPPGVNVALADGSVCFLPGGLLASDKFPDLLEVGGFRREYLEADWSNVGRRIHWTNCIAFAVWIASSGWLLVRAARSRKKASRRGSDEA
jgi:hypothetical protein